MSINKNKLIGGYGSPIDEWDLFDSHILNGSNSLEFWEWVWDELHHQGDVGSASYWSAVQIAKMYTTRGAISSDLLGFLFCLSDPGLVHDDIKWIISEYTVEKEKYLNMCIEKRSEITELELLKLLLANISLGTNCKYMAIYLDLIDVESIKTFVKNEHG